MMGFFSKLAVGAAVVSNVVAKKPNIVFVLTDDQDTHMHSLDYMPLLQKYMINEGTAFSRHFCTVAICCPSRVNLWTGRTAHNTNVTDIFPPYGGYPKIVQEGLNDDWLPIWMQDLGYNTYYTGKLWNGHTVDNYDAPYVQGFNGSDFILDPYTYEYYNARMVRNGGPVVSYEGQYSPDVVAEKAYGFLDEALLHEKDRPFMLTVAPIAPHGNCWLGKKFKTDMPRYAKRHAHLFKDYKIPRTENFNPVEQSNVDWISNLPLLNDTVLAYNDEYQRARLRSLQSVDEMVEQLIKKLDTAGVLDNTYLFYSTDNGYHISQHRMHPGKECGFDTDINIPLIIRGPGVAVGHKSELVTSHTDLAPTILTLASGDSEEPARRRSDGLAIPFAKGSAVDNLDLHKKAAKKEHIGIEFWGMAIPEGIWGYYGPDGTVGNMKTAYRNNTYKGMRLIGEDYNLYYSVWCTNERELYDLERDPGQIRNLFRSDKEVWENYEIAGRGFEEVTNRLDALMMVVKSCKGGECTDPWKVLHPAGDVQSLSDALRGRYDAFYEEQLKVSFSECALGYLRNVEGPQEANIYGEDGDESEGAERVDVEVEDSLVRQELKKKRKDSFKYEGHWSVWT